MKNEEGKKNAEPDLNLIDFSKPPKKRKKKKNKKNKKSKLATSSPKAKTQLYTYSELLTRVRKILK